MVVSCSPFAENHKPCYSVRLNKYRSTSQKCRTGPRIPTGCIKCRRQDASYVSRKEGEYERGCPSHLGGRVSGGGPPKKKMKILVPKKHK